MEFRGAYKVAFSGGKRHSAVALSLYSKGRTAVSSHVADELVFADALHAVGLHALDHTRFDGASQFFKHLRIAGGFTSS
jgi:hypothetical protein